MADNIKLCFECNRQFDDSCGKTLPEEDGEWVCDYCLNPHEQICVYCRVAKGMGSHENPFACEPCRAARNTDSVQGRGIATIVHKAIYGKDDSPNHADNRDDGDFQKGYAHAADLILKKGQCDTTIEILLEWKRRGQPRADAPAFKSWKRGLHAATMQQAAMKGGA